MEELAEAQQTNKPKQLPPSQRSYCVWTTHRRGLDLSTAVVVLDTFLPKAKQLMKREGNGGTDASLGLVMFCLVPQVLHSSSAADAQEAQVAQDAQMHLSTYVAAQHATIFSLYIVLVFNGVGRKKDKVKRSLESLSKSSAKAKEGVQLVLSQQDQFTTNTPDQFTTTMHSFLDGIDNATFEDALALLRLSAQRRCLWPHDNERDPTEYLVQRLRLTGGASGAAGHAVMAQMGLDLLGPSRPLALPPQPLKRPRLAHCGEGASSSAAAAAAPSEPSAPPDTHGDPLALLTALLSIDGELTPEIAADRAAKLITTFHDLTKELSLSRLHLQYYRERDALAAKVRSNARTLTDPCPLITQPSIVRLWSPSQVLSRNALDTAMRASKSSSDELVRELGNNVSKVAELCAPLKAIASTGSIPFLQLMYFGAAALAQGMLQPMSCRHAGSRSPVHATLPTCQVRCSTSPASLASTSITACELRVGAAPHTSARST